MYKNQKLTLVKNISKIMKILNEINNLRLTYI